MSNIAKHVLTGTHHKLGSPYLILCILLAITHANTSHGETATNQINRNALMELLNHESISWIRVVDGHWCNNRTIIAIKHDSDNKLFCHVQDTTIGCRPWRTKYKKDELCGNVGWSSSRPTWLDRLVELIVSNALHIEPFDEGPALLVRERSPEENAPYALLQIDKRWRLLVDLHENDSLPEFAIFSYGPWRLLNASRLTGQPLYAVIMSSYFGGSQAGGMDSKLLLIEPVPNGPLRVVVRKKIGTFSWDITPQERARLIDRGVYQDMRARPHYEMLLEPVFRRGFIDLQPKRVSLNKLSRWCNPHELESNRSEKETDCPITAIQEVRSLAGQWRLVDGKLRR